MNNFMRVTQYVNTNHQDKKANTIDHAIDNDITKKALCRGPTISKGPFFIEKKSLCYTKQIPNGHGPFMVNTLAYKA